MIVAEAQRRPWSDADNGDLINYWHRVGSVVLIAMLLNRSTSSVQTQASRLGLPRRAEGNDRHRRRWTGDDTGELKVAVGELVGEDGLIPIDAIAKRLGRSVDAVVAKLSLVFDDVDGIASRIVLPPPAEAPADGGFAVGRNRKSGRRPCLSCDKPFWSEGIHNRLCPRCRGHEADPDVD